MKSLKRGKGILVSVENITPFGIWLYLKEKEYFLSYKDYPYFKKQTLNSIQNVELLHGYHLYWPELDVDLEIDNLEHPEKYPLKFEPKKRLTSHSTGRRDRQLIRYWATADHLHRQACLYHIGTAYSCIKWRVKQRDSKMLQSA